MLIITGTMGAGKTTVLAEASDILRLRHIVHAAIDLDALGLAYLSSAIQNDDLMYRNLQSVYENYASQGVRRVVVARALENRAELELCCGAVSATSTAVCRLTASVEAMQQRVRTRERGMLQKEYVARVLTLSAILDTAGLEDFTVTNENRSPTEVAQEMLLRAKWI